MGAQQEPEIAAREKLLLAGTRYEGENTQGEIPKTWEQEFFARLPELGPLLAEEGVFYGCARALPGVAPGPFEYLAAAPVTSIESLPEGIVGWELPAATYAVLPAQDVPDIGRVMSFLHGTWLPESKEWESGAPFMLEHYPASYSEDHVIHLLIPIKRKQGV